MKEQHRPQGAFAVVAWSAMALLAAAPTAFSRTPGSANIAAAFTHAPATSKKALAAVQRVITTPGMRDATVTTVHFNAQLFNARANDVFTLPLGPGYRVTTQEVIHHADGVTTYIGRLARRQRPYSINLTRSVNGVIVGRIGTPTQVYDVSSGDSKVSLIISSPSRHPNVDAPKQKTPSRRQALSIHSYGIPKTTRAGVSDHTVIDILIVYSPGTVTVHPGSALGAYFHSLVDAANTVYANSNIDLTLHLVDTLEVGFGDGMGAVQAVRCMVRYSAPDGCNEHDVRVIHAMRAIDRADLVVMVITGSTQNGAGDGWGPVQNDCGPAGNCFWSNLGYASIVTGYGNMDAELIAFPHELGHELGAGHDLNNPDHAGAFAYSHGHLFGGPSQYYARSEGTVMAYADHGHLIFSSPDYDCGDAPCGDAKTQDNARTVRETKSTIAGYSETVPKMMVDAPGDAPDPEPGVSVLVGHHTTSFSNPSVGGTFLAWSGIVGPTMDVRLLKNDEPVDVLGFAVAVRPIDSEDAPPIALPVNLDPSANYELQFEPTYRRDFTFNIPLNVAFSAPSVTSFSTDAIGQTLATFDVAALTHGMDTEVQVTMTGGPASPAGPAIIYAQVKGDDEKGNPASVKATVEGLACSTAYSAQVTVSSAAGSSQADAAEQIPFSTLPCSGANPLITDVTANNAEAHAEQVSVEGDPNGADSAKFAIQYGRNAYYDGSQSDYHTLTAAGPLSFSLANLNCGTTYHYRVVAFSATGSATSLPSTFTTAACQPGVLTVHGDTEVSAADRTASYMVDRTGGSDGGITVHFAAVEGSAKTNKEFLQTDGTLVFADGDTAARTIVVPLLRSPTDVGDYDYTLTLSSPTAGATLGKDRSVNTVIHYSGEKTPIPPIAQNGSVTVQSGGSVSGTLSTTSATGASLSYSLITNPSPAHGTAEIMMDGTFTYTADRDYVGKDSFQFLVMNKIGYDIGTESITVKAKPNQPKPPSEDGSGGGGGSLDFMALLMLFMTTGAIRRN